MAKCSEVLRTLTRLGWYVERQTGSSHIILAHPDRQDKISFPNHGSSEMAKGTMTQILKIAGVSKNKKKKK